MSEEEQTVANNDESTVNQVDEKVGALDEFGDLLNEYDEGHQTKKVEPSDENKVLIEWAKSQMQEKEQERYREGLNDAVKTVKTEMDGINVSDRIVRGLLHDLAVENPKVNKIFENRLNDPTAWNRLLKAAAKEFAKEFDKPDESLTKDRDVVASAVRSASTAKPAPVEDQAGFEKRVSSMDKNALDKYLREIGE